MRKGIAGLIFATCALVACQNDVYDPNYNSNLGARVPDNFEWSTTKTLNVNVEVKDEYNGKYYYAVRVYDEAPADGVLPVAASSKVNKDLPFSQKIVIPATVSKLYIVQAFKKADGSEVINKKEIAVAGENITYSFGNSSSRSIASTRSKDNAIELKEGMSFEKQTNYYLNGEYTIGEIDDKDKDITITVNRGGKLNFSKSVTIPNQWEIHIEDGGKLYASDNTELTLGNGCMISNYGEVRVFDIQFIGGATLNNGDAMEGKNEGACFYANNIYLQGGSSSEKRALGERSYTSCKKLEMENVKLTLKTSAWLNCETLSITKGGANALQGEGSTIINTNYVGLATIGEISIEKGDLTIENNILAQCKKPHIKQPNITDDATGLIKISGTTCNEGGFGNEETSKLGEFTYIIEDMYPQEGDYDMNDIVVSMTVTQKGNDLTITGELKAIGASYAITPYIKVNNETQPLFTKDGQALEAHAAINVSTSSITNTIEGSTHHAPKPFTLKYSNIKKALTMDDIDFYIKVNNNEIHWNTSDESKKATWGMRIPKLNFKWAQEKVKITEAYLEFSNWFDNSSHPWYTGKTNSDMIYNAN